MVFTLQKSDAIFTISFQEDPMRLKFTSIGISLLLGSASAYDQRYSVYGEENLYGRKLGHRVGQPGYVPGADIITVGKLDGNDLGPFASVSSNEVEITKRWA